MELKDLIGQTVQEIGPTFIRFENGDYLSWGMEGDVGADSNWYQFLRVYLNGQRMASL